MNSPLHLTKSIGCTVQTTLPIGLALDNRIHSDFLALGLPLSGPHTKAYGHFNLMRKPYEAGNLCALLNTAVHRAEMAYERYTYHTDARNIHFNLAHGPQAGCRRYWADKAQARADIEYDIAEHYVVGAWLTLARQIGDDIERQQVIREVLGFIPDWGVLEAINHLKADIERLVVCAGNLPPTSPSPAPAPEPASEPEPEAKGFVFTPEQQRAANKALKSSKDVSKHPLVRDISDERNMGDGIWVYLQNGWCCPQTDCNSIHEDTWGEVIACLKDAYYDETQVD